ncbi:PE family protein [Mycobacterium asiaticum]|nr:PE family protein [Mycobacterium asiaticum]
MTFHPIVGDIGAQVIEIGTSSLAAGDHAQTSITGLIPAGADEVSLQAAAAFHQEAAALLDLNRAAQEELMRAGAAFTQIAQTYTDVDQTAAKSLVFNAVTAASRW